MALLLGCQACLNQKDFDFEQFEGVKLAPSVAVPLLHGSLTIEDLLPAGTNKNVVYDENQLIHLVYDDTLYTTAIRDHFLLKPLWLNKAYYTPAEGVISGGDYVAVNDRQFLSLDMGEADIDEINLTEGLLELNAYSNIDAEVELLVTLPEITSEGEAVSLTLRLPASSSSYQYTTLHLSGYNIDLTDYGAGKNLIPVDIKATVLSSGQDISLGLNDYVEVNLEMNGLNFSLMTGNFGQLKVSLPQNEIAIDIFDQLFSKANFSLKAPQLRIDVLNTNGVPVRLEKELLQARKDDKPVVVETNPSTYFDLSYPSAPGEEAGLSSLEITNINDIISLTPNFIDYKFSGHLNVDQPADIVNFITGESKLAVILHADILLWGYLEALTLTDTLEMPLQSEDAMVDEALIRTHIQNEFPLGADVQVYFTNEHYDTFDSLFSEGPQALIPASEVTDKGELARAGSFTDDIEINNQRFERILEATHMIVKATLYTSRNADGTPVDVKIKSNQALSVELGLKTNMNVTVKQ
ncbi:hypothetical protein [Nafulsella turpanensis]|uniref:hypothetical protein n=1 Tax=Nafulsella turpanensis TaxID=1265690 RepID=UPI0003463081|nr:hypothetical protein [Nafulsella turpanensis]